MRSVPEHYDIADIVHEEQQIVGPKEGSVFDWLHSVHRESRGFEIGTFQSSVLSNAMTSQSENWQDIALGYISDIMTLVNGFIDKLYSVVCRERLLQRSLKGALLDGLTERYYKALEHTKFLLEVERQEAPVTSDARFNEGLARGLVIISFVSLRLSPASFA